MGRVSFAAFRPHAGKEAELLAVIADRLPLLRSLGLATDREPILVRSGDGVIIQVSEWVDDAAIEKAHHMPEVVALWERFSACSEHIPLCDLPEMRRPFPTFDAVM